LLFNSISFIFYFLPPVLIGYYVLGGKSSFASRLWLFISSVVFYSMWNPRYVVLLLGSMIFNYSVGLWIRKNDSLMALWVGLAGNLLALCYFKYLFVTLQFLDRFGLLHVAANPILLPLGISFFTFTQIGYLIDSQAGMVKESNLLDYANFVTLFPNLIAGPILHHREVMPQLKNVSTYRLKPENLSVGLTVFVVGLSKKVLIADRLAPAAEHGFASAHVLGAGDAWIAVVCYSLQLYFDFSGYSDMAIGLAKMFGIGFPLNFNSPYTAVNIIDFWQRWHMTLTRYITLYIFNPLVLSATRRRLAKRLPVGNAALSDPRGFVELLAIPLLVTMGLAGVWHGAGLQFVIYGLLHGTYLIVNHAWRAFGPTHVVQASRFRKYIAIVGSVLLTYFAVLVGFVLFRADSLSDAMALYGAMIGWSHAAAGALSLRGWLLANEGQISLIVVGLAIVWFTPNIYNLLGRYSPALTKVPETRWTWLEWRPEPQWALAMAALFFVSIVFLQNTSKFLYFQF